MRYGFGVDLGGTTVKIAFFDISGKLLNKWEIPTDLSNRGKNILPNIAASILSFLEKENIPHEDVLGIGIGVPGPVDTKNVVNRCENLKWGVFDVAQAITDLTGFPAKAGNDATVAALGEYWKGGGAAYENMILVTLGTGVGGGIIIGGKPLYGTTGAAGEIGHMVLKRNETLPCGCGKFGCAEQYCSATGIVRTATEYLQTHKTGSVLAELETITCKAVFDAAGNGDEIALAILEIVYDDLAVLIANLCNAFDPQIVLLGGGVSKAGNVLLEGIGKHLPKYIFHACAHAELGLAMLGNDAGAYGAFKLVLDNL